MLKKKNQPKRISILLNYCQLLKEGTFLHFAFLLA